MGLTLVAAGCGSQALAHLLRLGASRVAELRADRAAASAFGAGTMISALEKISLGAAQHDDLRSSVLGRQMAFAMISDGASAARADGTSVAYAKDASAGRVGRAHKGGWASKALDAVQNVMRTHPKIEERVAALDLLAERGEVPR